MASRFPLFVADGGLPRVDGRGRWGRGRGGEQILTVCRVRVAFVHGFFL